MLIPRMRLRYQAGGVLCSGELVKVSFIETIEEVSQFHTEGEIGPQVKELACSNIKSMYIAADVFQLEISWLKSRVLKNIPLNTFTDDVFQPEISRLNRSADSNIPSIHCAPDVSHCVISPLKAFASLNMEVILSTEETSQPERSSLKFLVPANI